MANIAVVACEKIRDISCVGCLKCFKAAVKREGGFARYDDVRVVAMTGCGGCPGLVMPKATLLMEMADYLDQDIDAVHLATCMVKAKKTAACPIDLETMKAGIEGNWKKPVVIGTHNY